MHERMFSKKLRELRKEKGFTQEELGRQSGISSRQIQKYESGTARPRMAQAERIAEVLETTIDNLLGKQGAAVAAFGAEYGAKAERDLIKQAEKLSAMFAGGDIPDEDMDAAFRIVLLAYAHAAEISREKYTPRKYKNG